MKRVGIETLQKWRASMVRDCMNRLPDNVPEGQREAFRHGLTVGWRETINTLKIQGVLK
jgi:hypothetical protein